MTKPLEGVLLTPTQVPACPVVEPDDVDGSYLITDIDNPLRPR